MTEKKKILLAAGGTGGHFFPAIALSEKIKEQFDLYLVTDLRCKKYINDDLIPNYYIVDLYIKTNNIFNKALSLLKLMRACLHAMILIKKINPQMIIGFGGYPSFPALFAAKMLKIPFVLHEQNSFLGKTNRFFANHAQMIALSYKETKNIDKENLNTVYVGDVIRPNIYNLPVKKSKNKDGFTIFVFGGSQGAKIFADLIPQAIKILKEKNEKINLHIVQQALEEQQKSISDIYNNLEITHELSSFFNNMPELYSKTDLVISRAGASTIAELTASATPSILIPFPYAAEDHQYHNAKAIEDSKCGWCFREQNITPEILADKIEELVNNKKLLQEIKENLASRKVDGAMNLAATVSEII